MRAGQSIVLGIVSLACILGLLGFNVHCCCYSWNISNISRSKWIKLCYPLKRESRNTILKGFLKQLHQSFQFLHVCSCEHLLQRLKEAPWDFEKSLKDVWEEIDLFVTDSPSYESVVVDAFVVSRVSILQSVKHLTSPRDVFANYKDVCPAAHWKFTLTSAYIRHWSIYIDI
jgi:hypothetical protein